MPMPDNAAPLRAPGVPSKSGIPILEPRPITAPVHSWFTSPARTHPNAAQAKELPLHLIQLILTYVRAMMHRDASSHADTIKTSRPRMLTRVAARQCCRPRAHYAHFTPVLLHDPSPPVRTCHAAFVRRNTVQQRKWPARRVRQRQSIRHGTEHSGVAVFHRLRPVL